MTTARHILALLRSHLEGEEQQFYSAALQMAAHEARQGHGKLAQEIRELIDQAKARKSVIERKSDPIPLVQPKGDLANLVSGGVYFFDEFDAIGTQRHNTNDVGEIRRILNSFLMFLENDEGDSLIIAATNHPKLLDKALFRRFDDVIKYQLPEPEIIRELIQARLVTFEISWKDWSQIIEQANGLAQAEIVRATDEAAKQAVLSNSLKISEDSLISAIIERKEMNLDE